MKRAFALAAVLSLFGASAMADCPGHVSASASTPVPDQQVSTSTGTVTGDAVLSAQTDTPAVTVPVQK